MNRTTRTVLLLAGFVGPSILLTYAFLDLPSFGSTFHPYRDLAIPAAVLHHTANAVTSVVFDQRGLDTLIEEMVFFGSVVGVSALLRPSREEQEHGPSLFGRVLEPTRTLGYVFLPTTLIIGVDVVAHGHVTPGGGFQGGVIMASGIHLLYVAGSYQALDRLRPVEVFEHLEVAGAAAFVVFGLAGLVSSAAFLANIMSYGRFGSLFSAGVIPLIDAAVGMAVASGTVVIVAKFLEQAVLLGRPRSSSAPSQPGELA